MSIFEVDPSPTTHRTAPVALPIGHHAHEDLSGTAGTGKTYTARQLIAQSPKGSVILAATTGIAAVNLGEGTTINAALKYFNTSDLQERYTNGVLQGVLRKHRRCGVRRILIDEKSMLSGQQLTLISRAIDEVNAPRDRDLERMGTDDDAALYDDELPPEPEGEAIGLTLVGDFGQLPPIPDDNPLTGAKIPLQYAFDSPQWDQFKAHRTTLTKIWRQDAEDFIRALQAVRKADVTAALQFFTPQRFTTITDDAFEGTTIFAKNDAVERYNQLRLDRVTGASMAFETIRIGKQRSDWVQKANGSGIPDRLRLKEGALVMILANRRIYEDEDDSTGKLIYANGDLGVIEAEGDGDGWVVKLQRTGGLVKVLPLRRQHTIPLEPGRKKQLKLQYPTTLDEHLTEDGRNEVIGSITYMPLRAAYGCTVHKTQGLTLDHVQINIRDPFFRMPGMLFVALSRARTADGLRIIGDQAGFVERCKIEARVQKWL